ncbi:MAG: hypothetical protein ACJAU0_001825 [Flavobacteriales bacterium]|jgi:hypothetical protein
MFRKALLLVLTCLLSTICIQAQTDTPDIQPSEDLQNVLRSISEGSGCGGMDETSSPFSDTTYLLLMITFHSGRMEGES